jgi:cytochrome c-type biogenesis protein CcmF
VLGWGGYWGWDPVENAALLPWLTATAFLHSTMVQERRGSLKVWSLGLIIATFLLALFGTFEVRSGIISSVHSFAYSAIGPWFLGFLAVVIAGSIGLFIYRLPRLRPEHEFTTVFSREGSFLVNNLLLTGIAFATFWGTIFPILSQAVRNQTMTVGKAFYEQVNGPLFLLLLFTMGVGPLLAWRRASWQNIWRNFRGPALVAAACALMLPLLGVTSVWANAGFSVCLFVAVTICYELWRGMRVRHGHGESYPRAVQMLVSRHRQRYGGYLVHLGLVVLAVGVIGSLFFQTKTDAQLRRGESVRLAGYTLTFRGTTATTQQSVEVVRARFAVSQGASAVATIFPGQRIFPGFENQPASIVSITTVGLNDLYVFLAGSDGADSATIQVFMNPLVPLVWSGGVLMLLGGIACWWPERRRTGALLEAQQPAPVEVTA